jgi:Zn-dependent protease with chaperone function
MPFLLLLVLALICLQRDWPEPPAWAGAGGSALLAWAAAGLFVATSALAARRARRQLTAGLLPRNSVARRYSAWKRRSFFALLAAYLAALCLVGWGWTARSLFVHDDIFVPGAELLLLAPLLAGLVLSWAFQYDADRALTDAGLSDRAFPGRWAYVGLQARHNLLLVAPPLLLLLVQQLIVGAFPGLQRNEGLLALLGCGLLVAVFIGIPWLLRLLLGLKPLPDGPLRHRLLETARRLRFRFSDILVWDTGGTVANALVTGPLPLLRYVVLTDRLIEEMTADEIEAVFGHEVGHVKHHHMLLYFGFLIASLVVVVGVWKCLEGVFRAAAVRAWLEDWLPGVAGVLGEYEGLAAVPLLLLLGVYIFVVFGFLARRCERQADVYGARTVSCPVFIEALEKVARLNGIHRERPGWLSSWQHSTIALRVAFLERLDADPTLEARFQRRVGLVKWAMVAGLGASLGLLFWVLGTEKVWAILHQM